MTSHRYSLESYKGMKTRFNCPSCGQQKKFTRYIDSRTGEPLADHVGKCERANNCGYHYTPREYFTDNPELAEPKKFPSFQTLRREETGNFSKPPHYIPLEVFKATRAAYDKNQFVAFLLTLFDTEIVNKLISRYQIGTAKHWDGATVFWWIDQAGHITGGQVVLFGEDGHTKKYTKSDGRTMRYTRPMHKVLLHQCQMQGKRLPDWLVHYDQDGEKFPILFGLHLLRTEPADKPIALVEAPATAIVASVYFPQFVWLATGSLDWLTENRLLPLQGRNVYLFPDLNGFERWNHKATRFAHIARFKVSDLLERIATEEERHNGLDLRDYLVRIDIKEFRQEPPPSSDQRVSLPRLILNGQEHYGEILTVEPCDTYPADWDLPSADKQVNILISKNPALSMLIKTLDLFVVEECPYQEAIHLEPQLSLPAPKPDVWQVEELERFFDSAALPDGSLKVSADGRISDVTAFVAGHLSVVKAQNGKRGYETYLNRLHQIRDRLQGSTAST